MTPDNMPREDSDSLPHLSPVQLAVLLGSILIVALCGIVYELIIGTVSSYLMGNSVVQFSLTIGFFMFAMGIGSYISRFVKSNLIEMFVNVEIILAIIGGLCSVTLFMVFPFEPAFYTTVMFGFIMAIGFLVGIEIPLLMRVLSERHGTRRSIADVLSLDYVGALIGSVAFPLLLLPSLGLITSSFAIGLINISVALLNTLWLREHMQNARRSLILALIALVSLIALTLSAGRITAFAQDHLYFDKIVWQKQSPYQSIIVTNAWPHNDVRLFIDGHLQFSASDEHRYHEALVHPVMTAGTAPKRILILGGGDGMAAREVLKYDGILSIDLVDLDPEMTWVGTQFNPVVQMNDNALNSELLTIHNADAFNFLQESQDVWDRIIIDFPDPHNEAISKLYSQEFYALVLTHLTKDGAIVSQSSSPFFARRTYWTIGETMESMFPEVVSYNAHIPSFGAWGFHLGLRGAAPDLSRAPSGRAYMSEDVFRAATIFPCDISKPTGLRVNSIFDPTLYESYNQDLKSSPQKTLNKCRSES